MLRSLRFVLSAALALALVGIPSRAYASTSEVFDATGDVTPAYLDIVHAKVTMQNGNGELFFLTEVTEAVPNPPIDSFVAYNYQIDLNGDGLLEYAIVVRWFNGQWETVVVSPTNVPFTGASWDGATVKVRLDPALIGNPASFRWRALTRLAPAPAPALDFTAWSTWEQ